MTRRWLLAVAWLVGVAGLAVATRPRAVASPTPLPDGCKVHGFLPGTHTAVVDADESWAELWDLDTGRRLARHEFDAGVKLNSAWSGLLAVGRPGGPGAVFDPVAGREVVRLADCVSAADVAGGRLAVQAGWTKGTDRRVAVFDLSDGRPVRSFPGVSHGFSGRRLMTGYGLFTDQVVWDVDTGKPVLNLGQPEVSDWVTLSADGRSVLRTSHPREGSYQVYEVATGVGRRLGDGEPVREAGFVADGRWVAAVTGDDRLRWADPADPGNWVDGPAVPPSPGGGLGLLNYVSDGRLLAVERQFPFRPAPLAGWLGRVLPAGWWPAGGGRRSELWVADPDAGARWMLVADLDPDTERYGIQMADDGLLAVLGKAAPNQTVWAACPRRWAWLAAGLAGWTAVVGSARQLHRRWATFSRSCTMSRKPVRDDAEAGRSPPGDDGSDVTEHLINRDTSADPMSRQVVPAVGDPGPIGGVASAAEDNDVDAGTGERGA